MTLTEEEALLRVAAIMARADGRSDLGETVAAVRALPHFFTAVTPERLAKLLRDAASDVEANPEPDVMARILAALPGHRARVSALKVACAVAGADRMLSWTENSSLSRLATDLGLSRRDVGQVVRAAR